MQDELLKIKGVGPVSLQKLNALGIWNKEELLRFLPCNYIDLDAVSDLTDVCDGAFVLLILKITSAGRPLRRGRMQIFRATGECVSTARKVKLVWYNANYVAKTVVTEAKIRCYGKLKVEGKTAELINPAFEVVGENSESGLRGIKPIYPTKGYIPQTTFANMVGDALREFSATSVMPVGSGEDTLSDAIFRAHKPSSIAEANSAKERVTLEELVRQICAYRLIRAESRRTIFYNSDFNVISQVIKSLPYRLTDSQRDAVEKVFLALKGEKPLNSMLVGDVGSGKTVVALLACCFAAACGHQAAVMAPTEILAMQHFSTFTKILAPFGIKIALLTGGLSASEKRKALEQIACGEVAITVGTHAVLSKGVDFKDLSFVVVDEQHRFGVAQRTALVDKGRSVDTLTLSATPIPRSLRLTMFGDVEVLNIERRHASTNIRTAVVTPEKRRAMLDYIVETCEAGRQAYVVAPKIFDDEGVEGAAVEKLFDELKKAYGARVNIALLHGKLKPAEKQQILSDFGENKVQILVSTTVIEVGIDVPNASLMAIFDADRFGLATLHQLRGRIGRDGADAYCFLFTAKSGDEIIRLTTLVEERDGMRIAERDYELRGAGEWLGEEQSGKGGVSFGLELMRRARELADTVEMRGNVALLARYAERLQLNKISLN